MACCRHIVFADSHASFLRSVNEDTSEQDVAASGEGKGRGDVDPDLESCARLGFDVAMTFRESGEALVWVGGYFAVVGWLVFGRRLPRHYHGGDEAGDVGEDRHSKGYASDAAG